MPLINIQPLIDKLKADLLTQAVKAVPQVESLALGYLTNTEQRLATIVGLYAEGALTLDEVGSDLGNELTILENELLSEAVLLEQVSEETINTVIADAKGMIIDIINTTGKNSL